jgi:hypothetical protein
MIDQVYSLPGTEVAKPVAAKGKPAVAAKVAGKASKAAVAEAAGTDVAELGAQTIQAIVVESGGSITKGKAEMKVLGKLMKHALRESVRKWVHEDANLKSIEGVEFDGTTLSAAA